MGIQKTKVLNNGVTGTYWHVNGIYVSPDKSGVRVFTRLYSSQGAYLSGDAPVHQDDFDLKGENNPLNQAKFMELVEAKLITLEGDYLSGTIVSP